MNFQRGDRVVYGVHGVCRITDIEIRKVDHKTVEYYVLAPCGQTGSCYYVPVHNQAAVAKMRTLMSKATLDAWLESDEALQDMWIPEENLRKERYRHLISRGVCTELIGMIRSLQLHRQQLLEAGRKFHMCDENFLKDAKRIISTEVSQILEITPREAEEYLCVRLEK
jgi:CarD family transcriptional regulator